jgi:hypothetical protein
MPPSTRMTLRRAPSTRMTVRGALDVAIAEPPGSVSLSPVTLLCSRLPPARRAGGGWSTDDPPTESDNVDAPVQVDNWNIGPTLSFGPSPRSHEGAPRGPTAGAASDVARSSHGPRQASSRRRPPSTRTASLPSSAGPRGGGDYTGSHGRDRLPIRDNLVGGRTRHASRSPPSLRARYRHRAQNTSPFRDAPRRHPEQRTEIEPVWRRAVPRGDFVDEDRLSSDSDARPQSRPRAHPTVGTGPPDDLAQTPPGELATAPGE